MPWSGTTSALSGTRLAVGKPSVRPRLSPWATTPRIWNGAPRKRPAVATSPTETSPRMCVEETISPSSSTSSATRVSNASCARSSTVSPLALLPKRKFSPTETVRAPSRSTSSRSMNSWAVWAANEPSNGITTSSRTPSAAIRSALIASGVSSFGADSGATTKRGCGSKVSTVSAPRITSRWPMCTPSNSPTARYRSRRRASGSQVVSIRRPSLAAEAYDGLQEILATRLGDRDQAVHVREPREGAGRRGGRGTPGHRHGHAVARPAGVGALQAHLRQERQRVTERHEPLPVGVGDLERADRGPAQLEAVGVAQVGDERAHVGARGALDQQAGAVVLAPELLEAGHGHLALGGLHDLAAARLRVRALAADLDRAVGGRALADRAGRQRERLGRHPPLGQLALGVPGGRRPAQPRDGLVALRQRHQEALHARGAAHEHEQQPRRERVQRARVADLRAGWAGQPPADVGDDVVRGDPGRLVDEQHAVGRRAQSWRAGSVRRTSTSSGKPRSVEKPAARRCPPPPSERAICDTSTRPSVARRETLRAGDSLLSRSRTSAATAVPSTERRWSTTPSE